MPAAMTATRHTALLTGLCGVLLLSGCSVKEDRSECPVYVTVLTDAFAREGHSEGTVSFDAGTLLHRERVGFLSAIGRGVTHPCPRGPLRASVLSGTEGSTLDESGALRVLPGMQADLLWAWRASFTANGDEWVVEAEPHKQYCLVQFLFDGSPTAPGDYPWRFRMKAGCNGTDIYTLEPLAGDYVCTVGPNAVGRWLGVLPRQRDNDMVLEVYTPWSDDPSRGEAEYTIDLGRAFAEKGYDWTAEDLEDIAVTVGFSSVGLTISVADWEGSGEYGRVDI